MTDTPIGTVPSAEAGEQSRVRPAATGRRGYGLAGLRVGLGLLDDEDPIGFHFVLAMRFAVLNITGFGLVLASTGLGWPQAVLAGDASRISLVIVGLFVLGLVWCGRRVAQTSHELNQVRAARPAPGSRIGRYLEGLEGVGAAGRPLLAGALRLKLQSRIAPVRHIAGALVVLGLVGTVVGFIIALSGVDPKAVADPAAIGPMVSTLIQGMSVALYTTLVGAVLNLWLMLNYRLLESGTVRLFTAMVERGERHG